MALPRAEKAANFAFYSRILVLLTQIFFNLLMPDHDAKVFNPPIPYTQNRADYFVQAVLEGFRRWDSVYFIHIAEHGYTYENTLAFFPLYPMLTSIVANTVLYPLQHVMSYFSVLLISGYLINLWCFVQATKVLYTLSHKALKDETLAFKAVQLFCINPANIFFSAYYSEALFSLLVFKGMSCMEDTDVVKSSLWFGLSCLTRSNGLVNVGYPLYYYAKQLLTLISTARTHGKGVLVGVLRGVVCALVCVAVVGAPFVLYQYYTWREFCTDPRPPLQQHVARYGEERGYSSGGGGTWCHDALPLSYSHVQATHWHQGFLRYYQLKQTPNFVLAAPMAALCCGAVLAFVRRNLGHCATLGLRPTHAKLKVDDETEARPAFLQPRLLVYIVHLTFLTLCALLFMHVQVITRFICSSSPVIYWFVAHLTSPQPSKPHSEAVTSAQTSKPVSRTNSDDLIDWENQSYTNKAIFVYFHLYFFVGIGAFSNFLPWT